VYFADAPELAEHGIAGGKAVEPNEIDRFNGGFNSEAQHRG